MRLLGQLGQPEIKNFHIPIRAQHYVFRLDVAMDYSRGMCGLQSARRLDRHIKNILQFHSLELHSMPERLSFDKLSRDEVRTFRLTNLVDRNNVRMVEGRGG